MLGQCFTGGASDLEGRIFVYEVAGLSQNEMTELSKAPLRTSDNQSFQVPFSRMNQEMQRILSLGGKIVNIQLLNSKNAVATASETSPEKEMPEKEMPAEKA
ncbi:MAG: phycobilisome linker polypeptide [Phormidesmis sp.]